MAALYIMVAEKENSLWYNAGRNLGSLPEVRLLLQGQDFANRATVVHTGSLNVCVSAGNVPGEAIVPNVCSSFSKMSDIDPRWGW